MKVIIVGHLGKQFRVRKCNDSVLCYFPEIDKSVWGQGADENVAEVRFYFLIICFQMCEKTAIFFFPEIRLKKPPNGIYIISSSGVGLIIVVPDNLKISIIIHQIDVFAIICSVLLHNLCYGLGLGAFQFPKATFFDVLKKQYGVFLVVHKGKNRV